MDRSQIEIRVKVAGDRLDKLLAQLLPELTRSAAQRLIEAGQITVNDELAKASYRVHTGDLVVVNLPTATTNGPAAEQIHLDIIFEDSSLLVINKPAGMVVHPAPGHASGTLVNALLAHCPELASVPNERPGIVHRLDRYTSGLILVAKNEKVRRSLQRQFKDRTVRKSYWALLHGHLKPAWGRIEAPVGRDPRRRQRMMVIPGGREALTEYHVLEQFSLRVGPGAGDYSLVDTEPKTGRTHQIRVHFSSIGHPVVGDPIYGRRRTALPVDRQFLHARRLGFRHPATGQHLSLEAPLPADLERALALLRQVP